jgi:hypothetical protein
MSKGRADQADSCEAIHAEILLLAVFVTTSFAWR